MSKSVKKITFEQINLIFRKFHPICSSEIVLPLHKNF
jgi:hypothetical protein